MLLRSGILSLALSLFAGQGTAFDLDINSQDSIKSAAKTLASSVVAFYDESLKEELIPGLFPDPYYWWEAGLAFNTLIDYYGLTNDSDYNERIRQALQHQLGDYEAFMPVNQTKSLGNDDQSTWALASLSAYEAQLPAPTSGSWLQFAKNVFDTQIQRWDTKSCGGGLKWQIFSFNNGYNYKNTISNGQLFLLAARLADHTGNATYTEWANKIYGWTVDVGLITNEYHTYDGTDDTANCSTVNIIQWTNNHATFTEGAALMHKVSNDSQNWTNIVTGFANTSSIFTDSDGALVEKACEGNGKCGYDMRAFKGIALRSFARAAGAAPIIDGLVRKMLNASAKGAARNCDGSDDNVACSLSWSNSGNGSWNHATAANGNLGEVLNALQAVQALLWRTTDFTNRTSGPTKPLSSGTLPGASGAPQSAGAASTVAKTFTFVLAATFAAALCC